MSRAPRASSALTWLVDRTPRRVASLFKHNTTATRLLGPLLSPLLPEREIAVTVRAGCARGLKIVIDPRREKYYWTGTYEPQVQRAIVDALHPGETFWDIGAHTGFFTLLAARHTGPSGRVVAVEPASITRARLEAGIALNGFRNVTVLPFALTGTTGEAVLYRHGATSMWTLLPELGEGPGELVETRTLSELADLAEPPDLIKLDVEGAELDVLARGAAFLRERHPKVIVEFSEPAMLGRARGKLPAYRFEQLGGPHWLLS